MDKYIHGFWRKTKGRCDRCHRPTNNMYEIREGPVVGRFCGKFCFQKATEEHKEQKKNPLKEIKRETQDVSYWQGGDKK